MCYIGGRLSYSPAQFIVHVDVYLGVQTLPKYFTSSCSSKHSTQRILLRWATACKKFANLSSEHLRPAPRSCLGDSTLTLIPHWTWIIWIFVRHERTPKNPRQRDSAIFAASWNVNGWFGKTDHGFWRTRSVFYTWNWIWSTINLFLRWSFFSGICIFSSKSYVYKDYRMIYPHRKKIYIYIF